jgi:DNA-binding NarL/FixJ family response regulator
MQKDKITLIIADDHPIMRSGLRQMIEADLEYTIIGEAGDGESALALIEEKKPDVALLDIAMPHLTGLQIAKIVQERGLSTKLAILTMSADELIFNEAMDLGVLGYVLKENAASEVLNSIRTVAEGQYYISPSISGLLMKRSQKRETAFNSLPGLADLTPTEIRVLKLVAGNKTSKEIAYDLSISPKTVENHRANIAAKLKLNGNNALLRFALENKALLKF